MEYCQSQLSIVKTRVWPKTADILGSEEEEEEEDEDEQEDEEQEEEEHTPKVSSFFTIICVWDGIDYKYIFNIVNAFATL